METIPFSNLKRQYLLIKNEIDRAILGVLEAADFIQGKAVADFENSFAEICGVRHAVAVSSGTSALFCSLKGLNIGPGDAVITSPNTFIATSEAVSLTGAKVVFVDIDERTYNIDVEKIEPAITPATKAILPVHLYGQPADLGTIAHLAQKYNLKIVEDASQAHLAEFKGKKVGSWGDLAAFSFFPAKNLGAFGDAGIITTDNPAYAQWLRRFINHGREENYNHLKEGFNFRMDTLQAAVLKVKLKYLPEWTKRRQEIAKIYDTALGDLVVTPKAHDLAQPVFHQYVIRVKDRDLLRRQLKAQGIETSIHYPVPLHLQKAYQHLGYAKGSFPIAESYAQDILSLPIYPELTESEIERVIFSLKELIPQSLAERI